MQFYVDMDGVLVDFVGGMADLHNLNRDYVFKHWPVNVWDLEHGMGIKGDWRERCDADFWANLKKTPEADAIMNLIAGSTVNILTNPGDASAAMGKLYWLEKHYPEIVRDGRYIFTSQKHLLAVRGRVLIDDCVEYCRAFSRNGGTAIMIPRPWNPGAIEARRVGSTVSLDPQGVIREFKRALETLLSLNAMGGYPRHTDVTRLLAPYFKLAGLLG